MTKAQDSTLAHPKEFSKQPKRFGTVSSWLAYSRRNPETPFLLAGILIFALMALVPGLIAPHDPQKIDAGVALQPPSAEYWLGTDNLGRDIFSRLVFGTRIVMLVGIGGIGISVLVGVTLGLVAGYRGGWLEPLLMRITDALLAFPTLLLAILFVATFGASALSVVIVIALGYIPRFIRLVYSSVLVLKQSDYVLASRAVGVQDLRILMRHILPNAMVPIIVMTTLGISTAFLIEASMSYLGFGVQPPEPSWGAMLNNAQQYLEIAPWYVLGPGFTIFLAVLVFNLAGDRLREAADPKLRKL